MQPASQLRPASAAQRQLVEGGGGQLWHANTTPGYGSSAITGSGAPGLGITASHAASELLVLIAALLAALAIGALSVDAAGAGPRNPRWRARWLAPVRRASKRKLHR